MHCPFLLAPKPAQQSTQNQWNSCSEKCAMAIHFVGGIPACKPLFDGLHKHCRDKKYMCFEKNACGGKAGKGKGLHKIKQAPQLPSEQAAAQNGPEHRGNRLVRVAAIMAGICILTLIVTLSVVRHAKKRRITGPTAADGGHHTGGSRLGSPVRPCMVADQLLSGLSNGGRSAITGDLCRHP